MTIIFVFTTPISPEYPHEITVVKIAVWGVAFRCNTSWRRSSLATSPMGLNLCMICQWQMGQAVVYLESRKWLVIFCMKPAMLRQRLQTTLAWTMVCMTTDPQVPDFSFRIRGSVRFGRTICQKSAGTLLHLPHAESRWHSENSPRI